MWLYYFLIFFILVFAVILYTGRYDFIKDKIYILYTFILLTTIAAFRGPNVGNDTVVYLNLFDSIANSQSLLDYTSRYEIGYIYFNKLLSLISSNSQFILISTSIMIMYSFARFINKYSKLKWLSVYLFFTLRFFDASMNSIRSSMAMAILLFSYDFLRKRDALKFILVVILASLFHKSSIIFLLAWPITKVKLNIKSVTIMSVITVVLYGNFNKILSLILKLFPIYQYYIGTEYLNGEVRMASIMNMLVALSIVLFGVFSKSIGEKKLLMGKDKSKNIDDDSMMLSLVIASVFTTIMSFKFNLLGRVSNYLFVFSIVFLPNAILYIKNKKIVALVVIIIVITFGIYATSIQLIRPDWNRIYPYKFFWTY